MQYNKGMLSHSRANYQERLERTNKTEYITTLLNLYHTADDRPLVDCTAEELRSQIRSEINKNKKYAPKWFRANISFWLSNKEAWMGRS